MGCDIHMHLEVRPSEKGEGLIAWKEQKDMQKAHEEFDWMENKLVVNNRHYKLFSLLADVRNGSGFAGCDTGDRIEPIDEPRDIPVDTDPNIRAEYEEWGCDAHSASYFTLAELQQVEWDKRSIVHRGIVSMEEFKTFIKTGSPQSWCGGIGGGSTSIISQEEMMEKVKAKDTDGNERYYCKIQWSESFKDEFGYFIELMERWAELGNPEDVRIVFWFDN